MICDTCDHREVCYEREEDRKALKQCSDYLNVVDMLEKIKAQIVRKHSLNCDGECNKCGWHPCADMREAKMINIDIKIIDKQIKELKEVADNV